MFPLSSSLCTDPYEGDCPKTSFKCYGGRCLPHSWRCNGQVECLDEESDDNDELGCDCPCGGLLQTFYGTFSPPACQGQSQSCVWTLDPEDSRPLSLELQKLTLVFGDRLTIYNREEGKGDIIKIVSFPTQTFVTHKCFSLFIYLFLKTKKNKKHYYWKSFCIFTDYQLIQFQIGPSWIQHRCDVSGV